LLKICIKKTSPMFDFNPLQHADAWWQHAIMCIVAFILGYIIGYRKGDVEALEGQLASLEGDLDDCLSRKTSIPAAAAPAAAPVAAFAPPSPPPAPAAPVKPDDLKVVEGIGPKIEELFHKAGIMTFQQLADTHPDRLKEILVAAGPRFQMHDPGTWPAQSQMAADGRWDDLKQWQDELNKGK
jgi:predicted flap endonuclease-1-like 5' DNA nuclease